jgi:hypothetical protein
MPKVLDFEGFRFFFFSDERQEPAHVHVEKGEGVAKLWLQPVRIAYTHQLTPAQIRRIREVTFEHQAAFVERWNEYFRR